MIQRRTVSNNISDWCSDTTRINLKERAWKQSWHEHTYSLRINATHAIMIIDNIVDKNYVIDNKPIGYLCRAIMS